ncbi:hypothetical protein SAMN05444266_10195 [Chitinophaga jiangningensis]|uniref:DUF7710 domain-containing protein n=1 Tax=Chitinophaga jiangningensis TaxID=1419482 RepID=A0A1M6V7I0_9BACT|nr:hypothetical protein [Chitinophaga jiangningensis]SHK77432.1 hypothetical protein SAMN05444266_10195 [Chitinophaga jiangningensis]
MEFVWVFNGEGSRFASAAFSELILADTWIKQHQLTGVLTRYPINIGVYDWAIENGFFKVSKEAHIDSQFIGKFTTAGMEHYHYINGERD